MRFLRSPREIAFRLRQETQNLRLTAVPPRASAVAQAPLWPAAEEVFAALRGSIFAGEVQSVAQEVLQHCFPLLGLTLDTGPILRWRKDYVHGRESAVSYLRRIPYLDFQAVGDHKIIWELNRHQHLVLLAQAHGFEARAEFLEEIVQQLESWWHQNPFQRSINWCSALEVAFRAWSWSWVDHIAGPALGTTLRARLLNSLAQHGFHLEANLSVYFSPNTHLLGEAMVLHALGALYPEWSWAARWRKLGDHWVRHCLAHQVQSDGVYFEQSSYYHVYALDMFLAHYLLAGKPSEFAPVLEKMAAFLHTLVGVDGTMPLLGDDDGGRLFHPYGVRREFGRATLATCGVLFQRPDWIRNPADLAPQAFWWIGEAGRNETDAFETKRPAPGVNLQMESRHFNASGLLVLNSGEARQIVMDLGAMAPAGAGHSHADALQIVVRSGGHDLLTDPGTFTYISDPERRDWFRSTAAHSTVQMDGVSQATPAGAFRWSHKPVVKTEQVSLTEQADFAEAICSNHGVRHRRRMLFLKPVWLIVLDDIEHEGEGAARPHKVSQNWHSGVDVSRDAPFFKLGDTGWLWLSHAASIQEASRSEAFGARADSQITQADVTGFLPCSMAAFLSWKRPASAPVWDAGQRTLRLPRCEVIFPEEGGWRLIDLTPSEE